MDPNANLAEQRRLIADMLGANDEIDTGDALRLAELAQALDEWISRGGFLPKEWTNK